MLSLDLRYEFSQASRVLKVSNVRPDDAGVYKCRGVTGYGVKDAVFYVTTIDEKFCPENMLKQISSSQLKFKPCFLSPRPLRPGPEGLVDSYRKVVLNVGQPLTLNCSALGRPRPRYLWTKDASFADWIANVSGVRGPVLRVAAVRLEYAGHYKCRVHNNIGYISFTYTLIVRDHQSDTPEIIHGLSNTTAKPGTQVMLLGTILCNCKPVVQWLKRYEQSSQREKPNLLRIPNSQINERDELYFVIDPAQNKKIVIETILKDNGELVTILKIDSVSTADAGKYVLYSSRGDKDGVNYKTAFLDVVEFDGARVAPDATARSSNGNASKHPPRIVLYICIPIFILLLCSAVLFYCWSRSRKTPLLAHHHQQQQQHQSQSQHNQKQRSGLCHTATTGSSVSSTPSRVSNHCYPQSNTTATTATGSSSNNTSAAPTSSNGASKLQQQQPILLDNGSSVGLPLLPHPVCSSNPSYLPSQDSCIVMTTDMGGGGNSGGSNYSDHHVAVSHPQTTTVGPSYNYIPNGGSNSSGTNSNINNNSSYTQPSHYNVYQYSTDLTSTAPAQFYSATPQFVGGSPYHIPPQQLQQFQPPHSSNSPSNSYSY